MKLQLQFRTRDPEGPWTYHSTVDADAWSANVAAYNSRTPPMTFEYRLVAPDSKEALAKPPPPVFVDSTMPIDFRREA